MRWRSSHSSFTSHLPFTCDPADANWANGLRLSTESGFPRSLKSVYCTKSSYLPKIVSLPTAVLEHVQSSPELETMLDVVYE
jgi:hypothetical protein